MNSLSLIAITILFILKGLTNASAGSNLPEEVNRQMLEYAMKLDQIRKNFEKGRLDAVSTAKKLGDIRKNGKLQALKNVDKLRSVKKLQKATKLDLNNLDPDNIKEQCLGASKSLEELIRSLDDNGYILSNTFLNLDLLNIKNLLLSDDFDVTKVPSVISKLEESRKHISEQLEFATSDRK